MRSILASFTSVPRLAQLSLDLTVSALAFAGAYVLRFDGAVPANYVAQCLTLIPLVLLVRFLCRFPLGLHRQLWRYVSVLEILDVAIAATIGTAFLIAVSHFGLDQGIPRGILALDWALNILGYLALRALRRVQANKLQRGEGPSKRRERVLLVGAGDAGNLIAREILSRNPELELVGFVDDDRLKFRGRVQGIDVLGRTQEIPQLVPLHGIDEIILCVPSANQKDMRRILEYCHTTKAKIKTVPGLKDLINGNVSLNKLRDVQIEDLLGRDPVELDRDTASSYLSGRVVMVTGAGGSIGSELCRQIATLGPSRLILLGRGEFSVYTIEMEMRETFPSLEMIPVIADIRDMNRMSRVFAQYSPDVVFHAAAHKHVPLMEKNPTEAVLNNILGTQVVANLADQYQAETFVLISTDKAVNPTNVMGASKRVAEMVVQDLARRSNTRFMSVRFGNVLGSRGSVIPLFKRQIEQGGPITITHPEINRFFMTIPEASQLVLQAGAIGQGGEVFVLDMGDPVKIVDLARDLIKLSGLEPDVDVKIKFTGLRPGEKLYEELLTAEEGTSATTNKKIFIARPEPIDREKLEFGLVMLQTSATSGDDLAIRRGLKGLVSTYKYQQKQEGEVLEMVVEQAAPQPTEAPQP